MYNSLALVYREKVYDFRFVGMINVMAHLLEVRGLTVELPTAAAWVRPVNEVSLRIGVGESLGLVGESGSGKTMLSLAVMGLLPPGARVSGEASLATETSAKSLTNLSEREWRAVRGGEIAMVFQDPFASLNPRRPVGEIVSEPVAIHEPGLAGAQRLAHTAAILRRVGLSGDAIGRYPHEFSGGQRQRIGIARALILQPKLIVADEPVSALDVSVGAQVLLLLQELQREFALTYIFISHSLPVVAQVATRIAVMRAGQFLEVGDADQVLHQPGNDYTRELLSAVPELPHG